MSGPQPSLTIAGRFCGPSGSGNGGYVAGRLAANLDGRPMPVEVTLRQPPPLDSRLLVVRPTDDTVSLTFGGAVIAEAHTGTLACEPIEPVPFDTAAERMHVYPGLVDHPFPRCFVCGPERPAPDGLGLRPGRLADRMNTVATTWVPDDSVAGTHGFVPPEMVWAALDCPGGWSADLTGRPMVLGRMTAEVAAGLMVGDRCVVLGRWLGEQGRKTFTTSTVYDGDGRVVGRAEATWISVSV